MKKTVILIILTSLIGLLFSPIGYTSVKPKYEVGKVKTHQVPGLNKEAMRQLEKNGFVISVCRVPYN